MTDNTQIPPTSEPIIKNVDDLVAHAMNGAPPAQEPVSEFEHLGDNVVHFPGETCLDVPVISVLQGAKDANLSRVVIVGVCDDGDYYFSSSAADGKDILWDLQRGVDHLMTLAREGRTV